jgi:hypothetical protein
MQVVLGTNAYLQRTEQKNVPVVWDSHTAMNGHILIMGGSGSGKSYLARQIVKGMCQTDQGARFHIFDVHGDLNGLPHTSSVKFSEQNQYGYNPLAVDACLDSGGVRRQIQGFISALNRTSRKLGSRQEAVLRAILIDLYAANGFYVDKPSSWSLDDGVTRRFTKKHPTLTDAARFTHAKLKALYLGADNSAAAALEQTNRKAQALVGKLKSLGQFSPEKITADPDVQKLKEAAMASSPSAIGAIGTGRELDDLLRYDSREVLRSVVERLENLDATGIFRLETPPFDNMAAIWRYDIKALREDEQRLFVNFRLEDIFRHAIAGGVQRNIRHVVFLDEAKRFFTEEADNPVNLIATEGRKFGLGLMCASQSPTHFSDDFLSNVATKVVLRLDEMYWDSSAKKLKIEQAVLKHIVPRKSLAVQIKTSDSATARFVGVNL